MILADLAKTEFGVRRYGPRRRCRHAAQAGNLDPAEFGHGQHQAAGWAIVHHAAHRDADARWIGRGMESRSVPAEAGARSVCVRDRDHVGCGAAGGRVDSSKCTTTSTCAGSARTVTSRLLDRLAIRPGGRDAIETLPRSLPDPLRLDLIRGALN